MVKNAKKPAAKKPAAKKPAAKRPTAKGSVTFDDIKPLFGRAWDDPQVVAVLARVGAKFSKADGGDSYAIAKTAGFDLLARRPEGAKHTEPLVVDTAFMYREGHVGHAQFATPPYGLAFSTRSELLASMPAPVRTWMIGKGEVPVTSKKASHDSWQFDGLNVSADYDAELGVRTIDVSRIR